MVNKEDFVVKLSIVIVMIIIGLVLQLSYTGFFVLVAFNNSLTVENLSFSDGVNENITRYISLDKNVNVTSAYINLTGIDGGYINKSDGFFVGIAATYEFQDLVMNGSDFWVINIVSEAHASNFVYHFNSSGANQSDGFSVTSAGAGYPLIITTNGTDFWIGDETDEVIYHFNSSKVNQSDGFSIQTSGATSAFGITTNVSIIRGAPTDFWVVDASDNFVYHFNSSGANQSDGFSVTSAGIDTPQGVATNGTDFWVVDYVDDFVYHFNSSGANQSDGFNVGSSGANLPRGITTNGSDFWVIDSGRSSDADKGDRFVYHFARTYITGAYLDVGNNSVQEWNHTGNFDLINNKTANLASAVNNYLSTCTEDSTGNCTVPFVFHSDTTGTIQYSDISISYNDTQAPSITLSPSVNQNNLAVGSQVSISCSASDNIGTPTVTVTIAGGDFCSASGSCSGTYTIPGTGDKTVKCTASDDSGNSASSSITLSATDGGGGGGGGGSGGGGGGITQPITPPIEEVEETLPLELTPEIEPITIEDITAEIKENKIIINLKEMARLKLSFEEGPRPKPRLDIEFSTKDVPKLKQNIQEIKYIDKHYYFNVILFVIVFGLIVNLIINMIKRN